jgi:hypothetical protein
MDLHDIAETDQAGDRHNIAQEIVVEFFIKRRVDRIRRRDQQQRVAIGRRAHRGLGADVAAGAGPALDNECLAKPFGEPLRHQPRRDVGRAARRIADDQANWS